MQSARIEIRIAEYGLWALLCCAVFALPARAADVERQRALFLDVYESVERGNWSPVDALTGDQQQALRSYVLWPDLRAAWLRATMAKADPSEIESFLDTYGTLKPARDLRYRYALHLAETGDLDGYLAVYQQFYQGLEIAKLDCLALRAEIAAGRITRVVNRAKALWTVGESQVNECDPVFSFLNSENHLDTTDFMKRFQLAIDAREFTMARWLGKSIDQAHIDEASQWLKAQRDPVSLLRDSESLPNTATTREQLVYAVERVTYDDPELALQYWTKISRGGRFSAEQELRTARHIALWAARDRLPGAYAQLVNLPPPAQNEEVLRWRARSSLRDRNWANLLADMDAMSVDERNAEEWRYWRALALQHQGMQDQAAAMLVELATQRSYYGFLAADELGLPYEFGSDTFAPDEQRLAELAARPELLRARELFLVGLDGRGRSEWDAVVRHFDSNDKMQVAILAHRWGWHSRAIAAAASVGEYDDLPLRYPLPFSETVQAFARDANISPTWAYGVVRSESLFMRDVRSSAGAIGLMQLMPTTGKKVAQDIKLPYSGLDTLTNPQNNIQLGTTYLGQMAERFGGNQVLATAAYNAGPHRVDAWLPASGTIDARVWIENIPFNETRGYVRRVLTADTIFHWRITGEMRRLSDELLLVQASAKPQQVAKN
jgi:soluble lytic murein transglycosylase